MLTIIENGENESSKMNNNQKIIRLEAHRTDIINVIQLTGNHFNTFNKKNDFVP